MPIILSLIIVIFYQMILINMHIFCYLLILLDISVPKICQNLILVSCPTCAQNSFKFYFVNVSFNCELGTFLFKMIVYSSNIDPSMYINIHIFSSILTATKVYFASYMLILFFLITFSFSVLIILLLICNILLNLTCCYII